MTFLMTTLARSKNNDLWIAIELPYLKLDFRHFSNESKSMGLVIFNLSFGIVWQMISLFFIGKLWTGDFTFVWKVIFKPKDFTFVYYLDKFPVFLFSRNRKWS